MTSLGRSNAPRAILVLQDLHVAQHAPVSGGPRTPNRLRVLLDHVTRVPTAMKGWLRRLRGGVVGVVLAVDVDSPRERERLRGLKIGCMSMRMPPTASRTLTRLLVHSWKTRTALPLSASARGRLVRAARGRAGWIMQCAALSADPRYWLDGRLRVHVLTLDTEMRLRTVDMGRT